MVACPSCDMKILPRWATRLSRRTGRFAISRPDARGDVLASKRRRRLVIAGGLDGQSVVSRRFHIFCWRNTACAIISLRAGTSPRRSTCVASNVRCSGSPREPRRPSRD